MANPTRRGLVATALAALMLLGGCDRIARGMCGNELLDRIPCPAGRHDAILFQRDCGATTGFSTQLSVLAAGQSLPTDSGGNVLVADTDKGKAPSGPGGGPEVRARWLSADTLEIQHHALARIFLINATIGSVHIGRRGSLGGGGA